MVEHLFVYGTLQPGDVRWPLLAPYVDDVGEPDAVDGQLFDTGLGYPAAQFDLPGTIHGRRYRLRAATWVEALAALDDEEASVVGGFRRIVVTTHAGAKAFAYEVGDGVELRLIEDGRWTIDAAEDDAPAGVTGRGHCACGAVRYSASAELRPVINCHCDRCRRITGHFLAATSVAASALRVDDTAGTLRWYEPAAGVFYGFCGTCGSTLFWRTDASATVSIAAGTLDAPTGLRTEAAWYVRDASDYHRRDLDLHELDTE